MATHTTRLGLGERDRNLARPAMRRNPVDCKNSNRDNALKPALKQTTTNALVTNKAYDLRVRKVAALKPSSIANVPYAKKETAEPSKKKKTTDVVEDLTSKLQNISVEDIDEDDKENPLLCSEYINDIYAYMKIMEIEYRVDADYIKKKTDITDRMRGILVDWLIQVHLKFKLLQETLYLTVAILDRYLSVTDIKRDKLQLTGVTCMLIASKFEEIYAPEVNDFVYITDNAYTFQNILDMEINVLNTLEFDLNHPLPLHFLRRNSKAGNADGKVHTLGKYLTEICLTHMSMLKFKPSELAAGAFLVAQHVLMPDKKWNSTLTHYTGYTRDMALVPAKAICELVIRAEKSKHQAVRNKYSSSKFMSVSSLDELERVHDILEE
ncbi:G2/mitotic-specific cyclin-B-like [Bolinopsis microptera]|uniref:G2/mitotic-specific cyclin-B-like n=1 Tax=Bolinopsis microptera TaxID=2820187 RepID=UPI00307925A7